MKNHPKTLWLITARSGSKSIPDKNINKLGEYPLLAYRILSAKNISNSEIWISTDSEYYAQIALKYGAMKKFMRPKELSTDDASSMDVVLHTINWAENNGYHFKYIGVLEPTSPFISQKQLEESLTILNKNHEARHIVSTKRSHPHTFFIQEEKMYLDVLARRFKERNKLGRQLFTNQITPSGGIYISRWEAFKEDKSFYTEKTLSYKVDSISSIEIDYRIEWEWANFLIKEGKVKIENLFNE